MDGFLEIEYRRLATIKGLSTHDDNRRLVPKFLTTKVEPPFMRMVSSWDSLESDFSSPELWERYYRENPIEASSLEWHSSIPFDLLVTYCLGDSSRISHCLMVGCGSSQLPEKLLAKSKSIQLTLLDSSQSCIDTLKERYGSNNPQITYVCGNALALQDAVSPDTTPKYDIVLDKGLMDALFCSDSWDVPVMTLLKEAKLALRSDAGKYVLVSYKLSQSTQDFLKETGESVGFSWHFNCSGSNDRVWISIAATSSHSLSS